MINYDFPQLCTKCQGYKTMPYAWHSTAQPRMCTCPKESLAWECLRCHKINSPFTKSCDCAPSSTSITSVGYTNECNLPDPKGATTVTYDTFVNSMINFPFLNPEKFINFNHKDLNKNFTDK